MARPLKVRRPTTSEVLRLSKLMVGLVNTHQQRRAEALLLYGMGLSPLKIAAAQGVHVNTVYADLKAFAAAGVGGVAQLQSAGAPARLTARQEAAIVQLADQSPGEVGQPYARWSLRKLSAYLVKAHIVKSIGPERLRQVLKNDIRFWRVQRKLISQDPQRPAILARIRWIFQQLPRGGRPLFFDVKPVAVKAYGDRRYTSAKQLVLARNQKTRGFFYLFVSYDAVSGQVHWLILPGKATEHVCRFMRHVRRWYPDLPLWVALDQDRAHPCKSRETRRVMRALDLHWISLPKGSPDDNPVETLFSAVQLMILDNSNDPDTKTTQGRISAHLRGRNRRRDRSIRIPYLWPKHSHNRLYRK